MSTIKYILSPYYRESDSFILKNFVAHILRTYFITLIGIIFCGIFLLTIDPLISKLLNTASIMQGFRNADKTLISEYGNLSFLVICIIAPIIEESIFRLPLSLKKNALALSLGILFYIFSGKGFFKISLVDFTFYFRLIGALTVFFTFSKLISQNFLELIKKKYFKTFFFINAFLFGSVHISNYPHFNIIYFPIYFFYVLPQMVMGLALGSVQMQKGFWASVILHSLINSISFIF